MIFLKTSRIYFLLLSTIVFLLDQFSKYVIKLKLNDLLNKDFILFSINIVKNYGAAFNLFNEFRIFLSLVSIIFSIILIYFITM